MILLRVVVKSQQVQTAVDHEMLDMIRQRRGCLCSPPVTTFKAQSHIAEEVIVRSVGGPGCVGRKGEDISWLVLVAELPVQSLKGGIVAGEKADVHPGGRCPTLGGHSGTNGSVAGGAGARGDGDGMPAGIINADGDRDGIRVVNCRGHRHR